MHIAIGITLRHRTTGAHYKIHSITDGGLVKLADEANTPDTVIVGGNIAQSFEEFGPLYETHDGTQGDGPSAPPPVELKRCPCCGSTHLDATGSDHGEPSCKDCGLGSMSVEAWNRRYEPDAERFRKLVPAMLDQRSATAEYLMTLPDPKDLDDFRAQIDAAPAYVQSLAATPDEGGPAA